MLVAVRKEWGVSYCREQHLPSFGDENPQLSKCPLAKGPGSNVRDFGSHAKGNGKPVKEKDVACSVFDY